MTDLFLLKREFVDRIPLWSVAPAILLGILGFTYSTVLLTANDVPKLKDDSLLDQTSVKDEQSLSSFEEEVAVIEPQEPMHLPQKQKTAYAEIPLEPTRDTGVTLLPSGSNEPIVTNQPGATAVKPDKGNIKLASTSRHHCPPLFTVNFSQGSTALLKTPDLADKVAELRDWLQTYPDKKVLIEGHSSASGPEEINLLISRQRAAAVVRLLYDAGVSEQQLLTRAHGEHRLLANVPPDSAKNRRVSMKAQGFEDCLITANREDND